MKKMSEVFDFGIGVGYPATWSDEQVRAANKALKNIDSLADALEALTSDYARYRAINGIDLTDHHSAALDVKMNSAIAALTAYRGKDATPKP